jgi:hypothetical protein
MWLKVVEAIGSITLNFTINGWYKPSTLPLQHFGDQASELNGKKTSYPKVFSSDGTSDVSN